MAVSIVRLGSKRAAGEGLRLGTVRRPPRGVPKQRFAKDDWYDVWFPNLAPSEWRETHSQRYVRGPDDEFDYTICTYERVR